MKDGSSNIYAKLPALNRIIQSENYQKPKINEGSIYTQFNSILGRDPSPAELEYLGRFLSEKSLQPYEIGQILQATPEYQNAQFKKQAELYSQQLDSATTPILQNAANTAGAQANSYFAGVGRPNTSAMSAQVFGRVGNVAQNLATQKQSMLADFYGRGLGRDSAVGLSQGQGALSRGYGLRDETRLRNYQIQDYYRQLNDTNDALRGQESRNLRGALQTGGISFAANTLGNLFAPKPQNNYFF